jgi:hypothetical protein
MRRRFAPLASLLLALSALVAACGGSSGANPYELLSKATNADWDPIQVNIGISAKAGDTTISIDPASIGIVIDEGAGSGAVHLSVTADDLGTDPQDLAEIGVTEDSIDLDVVWNEDAAYARSPILATVLEMVLTGEGELPSGDLTGWLRLGTAEELASLMELLGGGAIPQLTPPPAGDAAALKQQLEDAGITLKIAGTEQRDGVEATHLTVELDVDKVLASDYANAAPAAQLADVKRALEEYDLEAGLWIETSNNHVVEFDVKGTSKADASDVVELTVKIGDPDGTIETSAPTDFVELPLGALLTNLMELLGPGLIGG